MGGVGAPQISPDSYEQRNYACTSRTFRVSIALLSTYATNSDVKEEINGTIASTRTMFVDISILSLDF